MHNGIARIPPPVNEPVLQYAPGSPERAALKQKLGEMSSETIEIPLVIGGRRIHTGRTAQAVCPFDHGHVLANYHQARPEDVEAAIEASQAAWREWSEMAWEERLAIFLKAADLLAGPWRPVLNAATMLGQAKTAIQAEIDSACELIDFWRFNAHFVEQIYANQPISPRGFWNRLEFRPLEGFVFAVTPFNFTAIGGNLPTAPAMLGNTVVWKPASTAVLSSYYTLLILEEAGLPPGVINFVPGRGAEVGDPVLRSPHLAGIHFTGSTNTFNGMWRTIADNVDKYRTYPRIVGETGGKDFVFAHPSANPHAVATALVRGSFEYQGQKCSASSRAYVPRSLWPQVSQGLKEGAESLKMGSPLDFRNFLSAVIDEKSFRTLTAAIGRAKESRSCEILTGGGSDASKGYFVEPTVIVTTDPRYETMEVELFGPVLTVYVYEDADLEETVRICDSTSPYALTGAIFAQDRQAIVELSRGLRHAAGNFYVNDKPTGAVVGQQPFGGARASGTNDKAGSIFNLLRWTSQRSIKETFVPPTDHRYPHMLEE